MAGIDSGIVVFEVKVGDVFKEKDSRFMRYVKVVAFSDKKAVVVSSSFPDDGWGTKETKVRVDRLKKRFTKVQR